METIKERLQAAINQLEKNVAVYEKFLELMQSNEGKAITKKIADRLQARIPEYTVTFYRNTKSTEAFPEISIKIWMGTNGKSEQIKFVLYSSYRHETEKIIDLEVIHEKNRWIKTEMENLPKMREALRHCNRWESEKREVEKAYAEANRKHQELLISMDEFGIGSYAKVNKQ